MSKTKPSRIQMRRTKGWRKPQNTIYVGRPSKWGNPYPRATGPNVPLPSRESVVKAFRKYAQTRMQQDPEWLEPLRGRNLACWCPLDKPCHADVLLQLANKRRITR